MSELELKKKVGRPKGVKKLTIQNGEVFSGETASQFKPAEPFKFLPVTPN